MNTEFFPLGDAALVIQFESGISPEINRQVVALAKKIETANLTGIRFLVPAYCSLTVGYDPAQTNFATLVGQIQALPDDPATEAETSEKDLLEIPVCYEPPFSPDLDEVCALTGCSPDEIIRLHTTTVFRVYMLGFLPGFPYLGRLPEVLSCPRKRRPRLRVPAGAVGLAGLQTGIYPVEAPGGWQIIGQTPMRIFAPERQPPFLFEAGRHVRFYPISKAQMSRFHE
ncbi:MAG: 5-oxoprolinase subunit PxpB [Bacteroidetes bacterium]|nr:MAG: 5-oxoprolinase subunit PxpB [Bacteroidota bacterium]